MNGKCAKRIRRAVRCMGALSNTQLYKKLKREYKDLPYHQRSKTRTKDGFLQKMKSQGHSEMLRMYHGVYQ